MDKRFCKVCGEEVNPLRVKALPDTKTCVNHSTVSPKRGRILTLGEGDHTYNEIEIMDEDTYRRVTAIELGVDRLAEELPEIQNYEQNLVADTPIQFKEKVTEVLDDLELFQDYEVDPMDKLLKKAEVEDDEEEEEDEEE